jgi:hypothetical protein
MLGVAGVFGGSLFSAMHGSLVTSSLIRETTENDFVFEWGRGDCGRVVRNSGDRAVWCKTNMAW